MRFVIPDSGALTSLNLSLNAIGAHLDNAGDSSSGTGKMVVTPEGNL
jgi:hypothetical protein